MSGLRFDLLVPALAWARFYGRGEPRATGAAWADDGRDDLSAAECDLLGRVMSAVVAEGDGSGA